MNSKVLVSQSREETQKLGEDLGRKSQKGSVFALFGDLGSGKTTFVQGFAKGLGIEKRIISPTFIIVRTYRITNNELRAKSFYHIDLYRTETVKDIKNLGIEEIVNNPENIVVIEWAEKLGSFLPKDAVTIYFEYINERSRKIQITK